MEGMLEQLWNAAKAHFPANAYAVVDALNHGFVVNWKDHWQTQLAAVNFIPDILVTMDGDPGRRPVIAMRAARSIAAGMARYRDPGVGHVYRIQVDSESLDTR